MSGLPELFEDADDAKTRLGENIESAVSDETGTQPESNASPPNENTAQPEPKESSRHTKRPQSQPQSPDPSQDDTTAPRNLPSATDSRRQPTVELLERKLSQQEELLRALLHEFREQNQLLRDAATKSDAEHRDTEDAEARADSDAELVVTSGNASTESHGSIDDESHDVLDDAGAHLDTAEHYPAVWRAAYLQVSSLNKAELDKKKEQFMLDTIRIAGSRSDLYERLEIVLPGEVLNVSSKAKRQAARQKLALIVPDMFNANHIKGESHRNVVNRIEASRQCVTEWRHIEDHFEKEEVSSIYSPCFWVTI